MTRKTATKTAANFTTRDFVLAGIGAISLGRKRASAAVVQIGDRACALRQDLQDRVEQAADRAEALRTEAEKAFGKVSKQATQRATRLRGDFEARLAPVLGRLGLKPQRAKKAATKRPARRPVRKAKPAARKRA